jgi:hypothetical protein
MFTSGDIMSDFDLVSWIIFYCGYRFVNLRANLALAMRMHGL